MECKKKVIGEMSPGGHWFPNTAVEQFVSTVGYGAMKSPLFNSNAWIGLQEIPGCVQRHEIKLEIKNTRHGKRSPQRLWAVQAVWWCTSKYLFLFLCACVCARVEQLALLLLLPWCGQMFVESFPEKKALSCKHFNNTLSFLQTDMV